MMHLHLVGLECGIFYHRNNLLILNELYSLIMLKLAWIYLFDLYIMDLTLCWSGYVFDVNVKEE